MSISEENEGATPIGSYNVYGKDIALESNNATVEDLGPVRDDIATLQVDTKIQELAEGLGQNGEPNYTPNPV